MSSMKKTSNAQRLTPNGELSEHPVVDLIDDIEAASLAVTNASAAAKRCGLIDLHNRLEGAWATVDLALEAAKNLDPDEIGKT